MASYNLKYKALVRQTARGGVKSVGAARKNLEIVIPAFSYPHPAGSGASQIVAIYYPAITYLWSVRFPIVQPNNTFVAVLRYTSSGVTYRYKLWEDIGEILPQYNLYIGETMPVNTVIEIWSVPDLTAAISAQWVIKLGNLEDPATPADRDGTDINPSVCVPTFDYNGTLTQQLSTCAA